MSGSEARPFGQPDDQPPIWVAFVTVVAAVLGVIIAIWMFGFFT